MTMYTSLLLTDVYKVDGRRNPRCAPTASRPLRRRRRRHALRWQQAGRDAAAAASRRAVGALQRAGAGACGATRSTLSHGWPRNPCRARGRATHCPLLP